MVVTCAAENTRAQAASLARGGPRDLLTCERVRRRVRGRRDAPRRAGEWVGLILCIQARPPRTGAPHSNTPASARWPAAFARRAALRPAPPAQRRFSS